MNLFSLPPYQPQEQVDVLAEGSQTRVERIVSWGQSSPPDFWYDQSEDEWVTLLTGRATLLFEDRALRLTAGDSLLIPARVRHRVERTSTDPPCVWLGVFGRFDKQTAER